MGEPQVVRRPRVGTRSLWATGKPKSGPPSSPRARAASAARASAIASSVRSVTIAFTFGFTRSICARCACSTSVTEARRVRISSRRAVAVRKQRSLTGSTPSRDECTGVPWQVHANARAGAAVPPTRCNASATRGCKPRVCNPSVQPELRSPARPARLRRHGIARPPRSDDAVAAPDRRGRPCPESRLMRRAELAARAVPRRERQHRAAVRVASQQRAAGLGGAARPARGSRRGRDHDGDRPRPVQPAWCSRRSVHAPAGRLRVGIGGRGASGRLLGADACRGGCADPAADAKWPRRVSARGPDESRPRISIVRAGEHRGSRQRLLAVLRDAAHRTGRHLSAGAAAHDRGVAVLEHQPGRDESPDRPGDADDAGNEPHHAEHRGRAADDARLRA